MDMKPLALGVLVLSVAMLSGCETTGMPWGGSTSDSDSKQAAKTESAAKADEKKEDKTPHIYCNKPVKDSSEVSGDDGCPVKGIGDWEGEIAGVPTASSKFRTLKIGMPMRQVRDLIGQPSDEGTYVTGKAWIPFYFGSDRFRYELVYKNTGRLIFAGGGMGDLGSGHLIRIIYNPNEPAYR